MTPDEAEGLFADAGLSVRHLDDAGLRRAWIAALRRAHPDHGGSHDRAAALNEAYHVLRTTTAERLAVRKAQQFRASTRDPLRNGVAVWAWAGAAGGRPSDRIERLDLTDRNFVKRRLWEVSGGSRDEWTIWPFDGARFLDSLTAYASPVAFEDMVKAASGYARQGFRWPRAVVAVPAANRYEAWLIGLGGHALPRPERLPVSAAPPQDRGLIRLLQERVSALGTTRPRVSG